MFFIYQIKIDKKSGKAILDLNQFFYPPIVLGKTAKEFGKICRIARKKSGERILVELTVSGKNDAEQIALNFLNHALALRRELC